MSGSPCGLAFEARSVCAGAALLLLALPADVAQAQVVPMPAAQSDVCKSDDDDDEEDDAKPVPLWKRFAWEGACFELSGTLSATYQKQKNGANRIPILTTRQGTVTNASEITTGDVSGRIDTTRKTAAGDLKTGFEVQYEKASSDSGNGTVTLTEAIVTWAGFKGGYTDSQMNYWSGDFQFSANAPQRTVGLAGYEFKLGEDWTLTLAYETGLPATQASSSAFVTVYPDDPAASARLYYEKDDVTFQLAGLVHQIRIDGNHPRLAFLGRPTAFKEFGWAVTTGLTLPVKWGKDGNEFSMQASYAVNASPYLGTSADLSSLASTIPVPVTTRGWSAVGSYHHVWSDHWESNVMASYLSLDISLQRFSPSARVMRYAGNLIWKPIEDLKIGAEVGYVNGEFDPGGTLGLFNLGLFNNPIGSRVASAVTNAAGLNRNAGGIKGDGLAGYLFVNWSF